MLYEIGKEYYFAKIDRRKLDEYCSIVGAVLVHTISNQGPFKVMKMTCIGFHAVEERSPESSYAYIFRSEKDMEFVVFAPSFTPVAYKVAVMDKLLPLGVSCGYDDFWFEAIPDLSKKVKLNHGKAFVPKEYIRKYGGFIDAEITLIMLAYTKFKMEAARGQGLRGLTERVLDESLNNLSVALAGAMGCQPEEIIIQDIGGPDDLLNLTTHPRCFPTTEKTNGAI